MSVAREQLLAVLVERPYRWDPVNKFTLASGQPSDYYLECKLTTFQAQAMPLVGQFLYEMIKGQQKQVVACGGLTQGADPLALALAYYSAGRCRDDRWLGDQNGSGVPGSRLRCEGSCCPG